MDSFVGLCTQSIQQTTYTQKKRERQDNIRTAYTRTLIK